MPRVASAAVALLLAVRRVAARVGAAGRRRGRPAARATAAGAVEPTAEADPTGRWIVVLSDGDAAQGRVGTRAGPRHRDGPHVSVTAL